MATETKKVITAVDKAAKALTKANADIAKTMADLHGLSDMATQLAFEIEMKASELQSVDDAIAAKEREAQADLQIRIKENEQNVLRQLLQKNNLAHISVESLKDIMDQAMKVKNESDEALTKAVKEAEVRLHSRYSGEITNLKAEQKVALAELHANTGALASKIDYLTRTNAELQEMLNEERKARVEMAKNTSMPVVNVNGSK